ERREPPGWRRFSLRNTPAIQRRYQKNIISTRRPMTILPCPENSPPSPITQVPEAASGVKA
ncbi:hypothetical protein JS562_24890, partial [Agrobacterium sp. S2]|nr:hypothetical protein [Agrobacterium sp. S2]